MITLNPYELYVAALGGIMGLGVILGVIYLRKSDATTILPTLAQEQKK